MSCKRPRCCVIAIGGKVSQCTVKDTFRTMLLAATDRRNTTAVPFGHVSGQDWVVPIGAIVVDDDDCDGDDLSMWRRFPWHATGVKENNIWIARQSLSGYTVYPTLNHRARFAKDVETQTATKTATTIPQYATAGTLYHLLHSLPTISFEW